MKEIMLQASLRAKRSNLMFLSCDHSGDCFGTKVPRCEPRGVHSYGYMASPAPCVVQGNDSFVQYFLRGLRELIQEQGR